MNTPTIINHEELAARIIAAEEGTALEFCSFFQSIQNLMGRMIVTGKALDDARKLLKGRFVDWISAQHEANPRFPAKSTCYSRMLLLKFEHLTGLTMKEVAESHHAEWMEACRVMRIIESGASRETVTPLAASMFRLSFSINQDDPSAWTPEDRQAFIEKAKPVVELYEKVTQAA